MTPPTPGTDHPVISLPLASAPKRRRHMPWHFAPYMFISPFLILFACFGVFPLLFSVFLSFQSWEATSGLASMKFIGLENYIFLSEDPWFWKSMWNTFWIAVVSGLPQHLVAIPLAYFIHTSYKRWRNAIIGAYFLPFITSSVAIALIFATLFSTDFGVINYVLNGLAKIPVIGGLFPAEKIDWIYRAERIKPAISLVVFWRYVGWNTVLYLAAMQTIPKDLYEAATIDGANKWQQFWYVTVPMLKPMMFLAVTLSIIGGLQLFEEPFILLPGGQGGTDNAGMTAAMYMYRTAFSFGDFGTASAISWLLFITIGVLTWFNNLIFSKSGMKDAE